MNEPKSMKIAKLCMCLFSYDSVENDTRENKALILLTWTQLRSR